MKIAIDEIPGHWQSMRIAVRWAVMELVATAMRQREVRVAGADASELGDRSNSSRAT